MESQRLGNRFYRAGSKLATHPITLLAAIGSVAALIGLKQTSEILVDLPFGLMVGQDPDIHTVIGAGVILYVPFLLLCYCALVIAFVSGPAQSVRAADHEKRSHFARRFYEFVVWLRDAPDWLASVLGSMRRPVAWSLLSLGAVILVSYFFVGSRSVYPRMYLSGFLVAGAGLWLGFGEFEHSADSYRRRLTYTLGLSVLVISSSFMFGELLWWFLTRELLPLSWQVYGFWAFFHVCCFALTTGAVIDAVGTRLSHRGLLAGCVFALVLYIASKPVTVNETEAAARGSTESTTSGESIAPGLPGSTKHAGA